MNTIGILVAAFVLAPAVAQTPYPGAGDLDRAIEESIAAGEIPGAVLRIGKLETPAGKPVLVYEKAYGHRALEPSREPMTVDTIFDAASLTKCVATTSCIMKLFEQGRIRLNDPVTRYLPQFQGGKSDITVRHLLTHFSGLRPDVDLKPAWSGYDTGVRLAMKDTPVAAPGERFIYSDINFILLGEIVRVLTGKPLPDYANETVFAPLGMTDTMFKPPASLRARIAPTERLTASAAPLRGIVHDPTTRFMDGVAGHAGLFTTAADLARFAEMMLGQGTREGKRIFSPGVVDKFTSPQSPADQPILRGLGWDIESRFSANRGELFPVGSYGHTGFTGTSLWIDPVSKTFVVLLTNSIHPDVKPPISSLRGRVATIAAVHAGIVHPEVSLTGYNETLSGVHRTVERNGKVSTGIDVLAAEQFARLRGKRVGLITNHTGITQDGRRNVDVMVEAGVNLTAIFSPEHGIGGTEDQEKIDHSVDKATGVRIYSLYEGKNRRPTPQMLRDLDVLIFDIQDIGTRFFTYMCTMLYAMEETAKAGLPFWVLDRPNPITGVHVEGAVIDPELESFVGCLPLPLRHGMTIGEIATLANAKVGAKVEVVRMLGWQRGDWFDSTGLIWVNPSPNIRSLNAALLFPGLAMLEYSRNYSVGRGTDNPFEQLGADWISGVQLARYLNNRKVPGVRFYPTRFAPSSSNLSGMTVEGVRVVITHRDSVSGFRLGLEIASALIRNYPGMLKLEANGRLIGSHSVIRSLGRGVDPRLIAEQEGEKTTSFLRIRSKYLLY
jgi:uncharacterized protein YbbC (DUF1343 family)